MWIQRGQFLNRIREAYPTIWKIVSQPLFTKPTHQEYRARQQREHATQWQLALKWYAEDQLRPHRIEYADYQRLCTHQASRETT